MEHTDFLLASGSVIGRDHRRLYGNYQDSHLIVQEPEFTLCVVTDGCGSSPHSEVGAQLGAHFLAEAILQRIRRGDDPRNEWGEILNSTLEHIWDVIKAMHGNKYLLTTDYFLFTIVGVLLYGGEATFFALGDGVIIVNGEQIILGPFPDNQPPYAGYGLLTNNQQAVEVVKAIPMIELEHFLIGTDGVTDLIKSRDKTMPGLNQVTGDISQFWEDSRYFGGNPDLVSRRLRLIGRDWPKSNPEPGLLHDDTTLIVGKLAGPKEE